MNVVVHQIPTMVFPTSNIQQVIILICGNSQQSEQRDVCKCIDSVVNCHIALRLITA